MNDPFSILGLAAAFDLTQAQIERVYLARAASAHPDLVGNDEEASRIAAELNAARACLLDPESRANALLARLGGPSKEADKTLPPGFLIEILETREEIEAAVSSGDPAQVKKWEHWAELERQRYIADIGKLFKSSPPPLAEIRSRLNAWRYVERLLEQLAPGYDPAQADFGKFSE